MIERHLGTHLVKLKSDTEGKYISSEFLKYLQEWGIQIEIGPAEHPQANLVSERFSLTIISKI